MAVDKRGRKLPKGIQQRYDGYEGRFMKDGKRYLVHGKTIAEVQKEMTDLKYKLEHGLFVEKKKITFGEWFDTWIEEYKKNSVKIGTYSSYKNSYSAFLKERIGTKRLTDIRGEHIQKIYNGMVAEGYSLGSIKSANAILDGCLKQAYKNGLIERNPVKLATMPRKAQVETKGKEALTREQQALFMEYAKGNYLYNCFAVLLRTGLRNGEIRGLKYTDIDKKKNVIHVRRTLKYVAGVGNIEETPKTKTSIRDIPLTDDLKEILEDQCKFGGFKVKKIDGYIFCNEEGEALNNQRIGREARRIRNAIMAAGYEFPHITPHTFRHTFATRAIEEGMKPQVLKTILGHNSFTMTMDTYSHVLPETRAKEMEKIANVF